MIGEADRINKLEKELTVTKVALADSMLAQRCLEQLINEVNIEYKTDIKKTLV
jgi:hypothetical protein